VSVDNQKMASCATFLPKLIQINYDFMSGTKQR